MSRRRASSSTAISNGSGVALISEDEARLDVEAGQRRRPRIEDDALAKNIVDAGHQYRLADASSLHNADQAAAVGELVGDRRGNPSDRAIQQDDVVGRARDVALRQRPLDDGDISDRKFADERSGALCQCRILLQGDDIACESRHHRTGIARTTTDVEHRIRARDRRRLQQTTEYHRLHEVAAAAERDVLVNIGNAAQRFGNEPLARNGEHRLDYRRIRHFVRADLTLNHVESGRSIIARDRELHHGIGMSQCGVAANGLYRATAAKTISRNHARHHRLDPVASHGLYEAPRVDRASRSALFERRHSGTRPLTAGRMAEWLCRGLQILVQRFDSASGLQAPHPLKPEYRSAWLVATRTRATPRS